MQYFCQILNDYILDVFTDEESHPEDVMDIMVEEYNFYNNRSDIQLVKVDHDLDTWVYENKKYIPYNDPFNIISTVLPPGTTIENYETYLVLKCKRYLDTVVNLGG